MTIMLRHRRRWVRFDRLMVYLFLGVLTFLVFVPAVWILAQSFMRESQILRWPITFVPKPFTFDNYRNLFFPPPDRPDMPIARWLFNSIFMSGSVTGLVLFVSSLAAYPFARMNFPGRNVLFLALATSLLIPYQVTMIPVFMIIRTFGWIDTYHAIIWPPVSGFFGVFFLRQFFMTIPRDLEDAARIDGCSALGVFRHVILPLSQSALVTLAIFVFLGNWNQLYWPLIVLNSVEMRNLTAGVTIFNGLYWQHHGMIMASAIFISAPVVILYLLLQRRIAESMVLSGLAGR